MADARSELHEIRALLRSLADRLDRVERSLDNAPSAPPAAAAPSPAAAPAPSRRAPSPGEMWEDARSRARRTAQMESRIGAHWLNRIGIAALLIGVAYFLRLVFTNGWIGPAGRIAIGLLAGIAVIAWSERFQKRGYQYFAIGLKAVGIGTLYLSLWAAFQLYHLVPAAAAAAAMMIVTASVIAMALAQDSEILAALALIGGLATPLLLSTGENRELQLFAYVALLDVASVVLAARRPWRKLLALTFLGTIFFYTGWYSEFYDVTQLPITAGFATIFFAIFALAPLAARKPDAAHEQLPGLPLLLAIGNAMIYFAEIYVMLEQPYPHGAAWFAVGLAALYVLLSRWPGSQTADAAVAPQLRLVHLALAIGFVTVAIPIRLDGHWITIGWAMEAAALLWVGMRIRSDLVAGFGAAALALSIGRLLLIDDLQTTTHLWNERLASNAVVIAILAAFAQYGAQRSEAGSRKGARVAVVLMNLLALIALSREVNDHFLLERAHGPFDAGLRMQEAFTYSGLWMLYGAMLMVVGVKRRSADVRWMALILIAITTLKVFLVDISDLDRGYRVVSFIVLGVLLLAISFVYQRGWIQLPHEEAESRR